MARRFLQAENLFQLGTCIIFVFIIGTWIYLMVSPEASLFGIPMRKRVVPFRVLRKDISIIAYFLTSTQQIQNLSESINSVFVNFNSRFDHPIVIFHLHSLDEATILSILREKIEFSILEYISLERVFLNGIVSDNTEMQMKFWANEVFQHPRILRFGVTNIMRVSHLYRMRNEVNFDLFKFMQRLDLYYVYYPPEPEEETEEILIYTQEMIPFIYLYSKQAKLLPFQDPRLEWVNRFQFYEYQMGPGEKRLRETSFELLHLPSWKRLEFFKQWYTDFAIDWAKNMYVWPGTRAEHRGNEEEGISYYND